jgi:hypothetical protein
MRLCYSQTVWLYRTCYTKYVICGDVDVFRPLLSIIVPVIHSVQLYDPPDHKGDVHSLLA